MTVAGPNLPLKDDVFQAVFMGACALIAMPIGAFFGGIWAALAGALGALIIGVILSGAILGVYRAVRHMQGKHDTNMARFNPRRMAAKTTSLHQQAATCPPPPKNKSCTKPARRCSATGRFRSSSA